MGFRTLRVINEDVVMPGQGFGMHGHRDMEIVTYVISGALEHRDSLGNGGILRPGEVQRMTAGTGIRHSEFNPSADEPVHLYQIWLLPERTGLAPSYEQKSRRAAGRRESTAADRRAAGPGRDARDPPGCEGLPRHFRARYVLDPPARARPARVGPGGARVT